MEAVQTKIIDLLKELSGRFSTMTFMYGFDTQACQHLVDVSPSSAYTTDDYMDAESDAQAVFFDAFPYESLAFVSSHPYIRVTDPLFVAFRKQIIPYTLLVSEMAAPVMVANALASPTMSAYELLYSSSAVSRPTFAVEQYTTSLKPVLVDKGTQFTSGEYNYGMAA